MLEAFARLADERIKTSMKNGDFDDLEGQGRPFEFEDDSMIPPDLRMAYKILKNAGYIPPEVQAAKDIRCTLDLLESTDDEYERYRGIQRLNMLITRLNLRRGGNVAFDEDQVYYHKVVEKMSPGGS